MKNIILCGLPGVGKSTVGKIHAEKLSYQFFDIDLCLEEQYHKTIGTKLTCREIHKLLGEIDYRSLEHKVIYSFLNSNKYLLALGGGSLILKQNRDIIKNLGTIVYLKNDRRTIFDRLMNKGMPTFIDPHNPFLSFNVLADNREPIYASLADLHIECDKLSPEEISNHLLGKHHV